MQRLQAECAVVKEERDTLMDILSSQNAVDNRESSVMPQLDALKQLKEDEHMECLRKENDLLHSQVAELEEIVRNKSDISSLHTHMNQAITLIKTESPKMSARQGMSQSRSNSVHSSHFSKDGMSDDDRDA